MPEHTISVIHGDQATKVPNATAKGDQLWLSAGDLAQVAGWVLKPEGFCRGELCVPVPAARRGELVSGDSYNLAALASMLGQPVIHDAEHAVWSIGEASSERKRSLTALEAPDFSLPDLNGTQHSLREQRGKKVLLVSWASW